MHHLMRDLMGQCCEVFGRTLFWQKRDLAACGGAASRGDVLRVFEKNALLSDEFTEPVTVFAGIAVDVADFRKFFTVRLANVLYRDLSKSSKYWCIWVGSTTEWPVTRAQSPK
jgi:hypothetical protein